MFIFTAEMSCRHALPAEINKGSSDGTENNLDRATIRIGLVADLSGRQNRKLKLCQLTGREVNSEAAVNTSEQTVVILSHNKIEGQKLDNLPLLTIFYSGTQNKERMLQFQVQWNAVTTTPGGHSPVMGYWGCAAGWGRIFTTRLTIIGSPFQAFSIELLEWGRTFSGL